jgi:hypothetical protein
MYEACRPGALRMQHAEPAILHTAFAVPSERGSARTDAITSGRPADPLPMSTCSTSRAPSDERTLSEAFSRSFTRF